MSGEFRPHDVEAYLASEKRRAIGKSIGRTASALLSLLFGAYSADLGYTLFTEPEHASTMQWTGTIPCKDAEFATVIVGSTGKDITDWQAENNQAAIENAGGATLVTKYSTDGDIGEFRKSLDAALASCARLDRPYVPVIFNGISLGGKYSQWVTNAGLRNGIPEAIIMEASPTGIDSVKNVGARALLSVTKPSAPVPMTKGIVFGNSMSTEIDRYGSGVFTSPVPLSNARKSTEGTNAKTLTWQLVADAQPWPIAVRAGDNSVPIEYIYTDADAVIDTALVRTQLKLFTRAEVTEHWIPAEKSWDSAPSHTDGWRQDATNSQNYRETYTSLYRKYRTLIDQHKQEVARSLVSPYRDKHME